MRCLLTLILITIGLNSQWHLLAADLPGLNDRDFDLGESVGRCLAIKCQVFTGYLLTDGPPSSGESVVIRAGQWLLGTPQTVDSVALPYATARSSGDVYDPALTWAKVEFARNVPVIVVLPEERGFGLQAATPVLVTSSEREINIVRSLAQETLLVERSPEVLEEAVESLRDKPNAATAGYLFAYLTLSHKNIKRGLSARLLLEMVGNPGVPATKWSGIALPAVGYSGSLSPEGRGAIVQQFVSLAKQLDTYSAKAGFTGLDLITRSGISLDTLMPRVMLNTLAEKYCALLATGVIDRSSALESQFRVSPQ
jgi:hypothetical protein